VFNTGAFSCDERKFNNRVVYETYIFDLSVGCGWLELKEHDVEDRHGVLQVVRFLQSVLASSLGSANLVTLLQVFDVGLVMQIATEIGRSMFKLV
jgi:hypothetical protein